jgi:DNA processing protein
MEVFDAPTHYYPSDAMSLDELAYWITFNRVSGIGPVSFKSLLEYFDNDLQAAWRADTKELAQAGLTQKTIENVITLRTTSTPQRELEKLEKLRIQTFHYHGIQVLSNQNAFQVYPRSTLLDQYNAHQ